MTRIILLFIAALLLVGSAIADEPTDSTQVNYTLGYRYLSVDGNEWRFRQYTSPDDGPFVTTLGIQFANPKQPEEPTWDVMARLLSPHDFDAALRVLGAWPIPVVDVYYNTYQFHPEMLRYDLDSLTFARDYTKDSAQRRVFGASSVFYWLNEWPVDVSYTRTLYAGSGWRLGLDSPATPDFDTRDIRIAKHVRIGKRLSVDTEYTERRFSDGTALQPDSRTRAEMLSLTTPLGANGSVQGEYEFGSVEMKGYDGLDYTRGGLIIDTVWNSGLGLTLYANRTTVDNDVTLTPYTKEVVRTGVKASYVGRKHIALRGGVELRSFKQQLTDSGTSDAEPDRTSYWVSVTARPLPKTRVRAKYMASDTSGLGEGEEGSMPDKRSRAQVDLNFTPSDRLAVTLANSQDKRKNPNEANDYELNTYAATVSSQLTDQVTLIGHYTIFDWDSDASTLKAFISDAIVWGGYVQIAATPKGNVSLGYEQARSEDASDTRDQSVTLGIAWAASPDCRYSIEYRHQAFDDYVITGSTFKANMVSLNGAFKF